MLIQNPIGFYTLTRREVSRFLKVYIQTIVAPFLSNILFLGVFGSLLFTQKGGSQEEYLMFLVPGLCIMGAIMNSYQNPSSSMIIHKYRGMLQELNSYPLTTLEKLLAYLIGGVIRGIIVAYLTMAAASVFVDISITFPFLFFFMISMVSLVFSALGIIIGLIFDGFDVMSFILTIVLTPLLYFGGVFFKVSELPPIFASIMMFNPLFPFIDMVRYAYLGSVEGVLLYESIAFIIITIATLIAAYIIFDKGIGLRD